MLHLKQYWPNTPLLKRLKRAKEKLQAQRHSILKPELNRYLFDKVFTCFIQVLHRKINSLKSSSFQLTSNQLLKLTIMKQTSFINRVLEIMEQQVQCKILIITYLSLLSHSAAIIRTNIIGVDFAIMGILTSFISGILPRSSNTPKFFSL